MTVNIRQTWLDYYKNKGFKVISSAPLVHPAFPTSFNMSAGLVQLDPRIRQKKKIEMSKECLVQKCIRHFDINKVGDSSHLSFFEMAGVFDVVEIDEKRVIKQIWSFLTEVLQIDSSKLWITAFDEDRVAGKVISLPSGLKSLLNDLVGDRVIYGGQKTNLWKQGGGVEFTDNIRLCGPQVEFFYDFGEDLSCGKGCNVFCDCGRFLEISNTLFIYYYIDCNEEPELKEVVNRSTETVIGIERCAMIVEKQKDLFLTSCFSPLISVLNKKLDEDVKIIIDHIKSLVFILSEEKIKPIKRGRGRIIRTLIRQLLASLYVLKLKPRVTVPLLVDEVIKMYQDFYPEVKDGKETALKVIFEHEKVYKKTLGKAKRKIEKYLIDNKATELSEEKKEYFWLQYGVPKKLLPVLMASDFEL
ncbi:MAG: alanine--tRNA ligase-related protein [Candidatus Beckwithbacteria bacterium]